MYTVGLVGLGFMGRSHVAQYAALQQNGLPVKLAAVCDVDGQKLSPGGGVAGNIDTGSETSEISGYTPYTDMENMIREEKPDFVDLCLPTYLHAPMAIKAMEMGVHVFCEKPMAISNEACRAMINAAKAQDRRLMIGHTLRYWNVYEYAKDCLDDGRYGACVGAYFFRGGATPIWSWENWLLTREKSGGCLLDQHVHDVDAINWFFGTPKSVSSTGRIVMPGSGYDVVSTNYLYDGVVVNAQDDWTINGSGFGFEMRYRMNFEKAALIYENGTLTVHPVGESSFIPLLSEENAYYKELRIFLNLLENKNAFDYIGLLESHRNTILMAEAEMRSADRGGLAEPILP